MANHKYHNEAIRAFQFLDEALRPFVEQEMAAIYKEDWLRYIANSVRWERDEPVWDTLALLHTIRINWQNVFKVDKLRGPEEIGKVSALIDWRHRIQGHSSKPIDMEEAEDAVRSMLHLLKKIGAKTEATEVEQILVSLQPAVFSRLDVVSEADRFLPHTSEKIEAELKKLEQIVSSPAPPLSSTVAKSTLAHIIRQFKVSDEIEEAEITDAVVLLRIDRSYRFGITAAELYEATRGDWAITPEKRRVKPRYAAAVVSFVIREVYEIDDWFPFPASSWGDGRWRFNGIVASDKADLIGKSVQSYINRRSTNPVNMSTVKPTKTSNLNLIVPRKRTLNGPADLS